MPRKVDKLQALNQQWNLFVNPVDKAEFMLALTKSGKTRAAAAAVRAFMHLYATDNIVRDKVNNIIDDYIIYKDSGDKSIL